MPAGMPSELLLRRPDIVEAERHLADGHFAEGSMRPKVEAAVAFARSGPGRKTLITLLSKAKAQLDTLTCNGSPLQ